MMEPAYHLDHAMLHSRNRGRCTRIHANLGRGVDGCQLFDGENANDKHCGACGCHMEFHVKLSQELKDPRSKRYKRSPSAESPAESVGDNIDAPGVEVTSGSTREDYIARVLLSSSLDDKPAQDEIDYTRTPLYSKLSSKLKVIQEGYPEAVHGKFSIVYDEYYGYRVHCGSCDRKYGIVKPGFSLGNFERGHLASKRHNDLCDPELRALDRKTVGQILQEDEAKRTLKTLRCQ